MKVEQIDMSGVVELFNDILELDGIFKEKGLTSNPDDDRVRLGSKSSYLLDQVSVTFKLSNMTLYDMDIVKRMSSKFVLLNKNSVSESPFASHITLNLSHPDIFNMIKKSAAVVSDLRQVDANVADMVQMSGCQKFSALATFSGINVLSLFNGFIENFVYKNFQLGEVENGIPSILQELYQNFTNIFMKTCHQNAQRSGLVEDFLIQKKFFSFVQKGDSNTSSLSKITYPFGEIRFFGTTSVDDLMNQISMFQSSESSKNDGYDKSVSAYYTCSTDITTFMFLKSFGVGFDIIAYESLDILFSDKSPRFTIPKKIQTSHGGRINLMIDDNISCRSIVMLDKDVTKNLSHPSNRYGMIFNGQRIKFVVKFYINDSYRLSLDTDNDLAKPAKILLDNISGNIKQVSSKFLFSK